jgi:hypothetical protein
MIRPFLPRDSPNRLRVMHYRVRSEGAKIMGQDLIRGSHQGSPQRADDAAITWRRNPVSVSILILASPILIGGPAAADELGRYGQR